MPDKHSGDRWCWVGAVLIGLAFAAAAMSFSLWWAGPLLHTNGWFVPGDIWMTVNGGRFVWSGALGYVYQGTSSYALPLSFIVMAPVAGLIDHYGLIEGSPVAVLHPNAWLLVGPYALVAGIFLLHAVRRLAWDVGVRSRLWAVQMVAVVVVLVPCFEWGHFEDVIALTLAIHAIRRVLRGDHLRAALLLSIAVASKEWAVMLVPFVVWAAPRGRRLRTLGAAIALPGALALFVLGVDWSDASRALLAPVDGEPTGHLVFYAGWLGSNTSRLTRMIGLGCAPPAGWWAARRARGRVAVVAAAALLLGLRPLFEVENFSYYLSPGLLLAGVVGLAAHRTFRLRDWIWPTLAVIWALPRGNPATGNWWYAGEAILLLLTAAQAASNFGVWISPELWFRKGRKEPMFTDMAMPIAAGEKSWNR